MSWTACSGVPSGTWVVMLTRYSIVRHLLARPRRWGRPRLTGSGRGRPDTGDASSGRRLPSLWTRSWRSGRGRLAGARDLAVQRFQRVDVDLGEGGEGLDDIAQHLDRHPGADGQRGLLQPLAGLGAQRV